MSEGNGTREIALTAPAAKVLAEELQAYNTARARFEAVFRFALAQAGETGGRFEHLQGKEDGSAVLVIATNSNGGY